MTSRAPAAGKSSRTVGRLAPSPDTWNVALASLQRARTQNERELALVAFTEAVGPGLPGLARDWEAVVALMRAAIASPGFAEAMVGEASSVVDVVDLPLMTAEDLALEAVAFAGAHNRVLHADTMLTAAAVSELLGSHSSNARQYANRLRSSSRVVAVPSRNRYLYPAFQIDEERRVIRPRVAEVNSLLRAAEDPWGVASWWLLPSVSLQGRSPAHELEREGGPETVFALASDLVSGD